MLFRIAWLSIGIGDSVRKRWQLSGSAYPARCRRRSHSAMDRDAQPPRWGLHKHSAAMFRWTVKSTFLTEWKRISEEIPSEEHVVSLGVQNQGNFQDNDGWHYLNYFVQLLMAAC